MLAWKDLDRILRGEATRSDSLKRGTIEIPAVGVSAVLVLLAMAYGVCMGCFAVFKGGGPSVWQLVATTMKVPALFVTFSSLYVFSALVGIQMGWILRPFIGTADQPVQFFRADLWDNAYVIVARMIWNLIGLRGRSG